MKRAPRRTCVLSLAMACGPVFAGAPDAQIEPMAGTSAAAPADAGAAAKVERTVWRLTRLRGQPDKTIAGLPRVPTLRLEAGRAQAFGGCNRLVGSYTLDRDRVTFGAFTGTMMACPEPAMAVETAFKAALAGALVVHVDPEGLTLTPALGSDPGLGFVPEPQAVP
jgi:putative lipoprotein